MKSIDIEELKKIQIDILDDIHEFCSINKIGYSLAYGTLLGAIRHKGYIPWDDDIDIMMLRSDYDRFINSFSGYREYLDICAPELNLDYYAPYANVWNNKTVLYEGDGGANNNGKPIGIKIDVFPIDNTSSSRFSVWTSKLLYRLWSFHRYYKSGKRKVPCNWRSLYQRLLNLISKAIGYRNVQKLIMINAKRMSNKKTRFLDMLVFYNNGDRKFHAEDFDSYLYVEFEGKKFYSLVGFDDYLKSAFGDYMQLPPEEKRVSNHTFKAYWKD